MRKKSSLLRKVSIITLGILILSLFLGMISELGLAGGYTGHTKVTVEQLSKKFIRLHVIANSDSPEDQELKLSVRDSIIEALDKQLEGVEDIDTSREFIKNNLHQLEDIARGKIHELGKDYKVKAVFGKFPFPVKSYGYVTLPAGDYEALRIIIGDGSGANWWCVLFPPLCFVDITHGVTKDDAKISLGKYLTAEEMAAVETAVSIDELPVEIRFKVVEWWNTAVGKIQRTIKLALK